MSPQDFKRRERVAAAELEKIGELENARTWLRTGGVDAGWTGTPLEFALLEMPVGFAGRVLRWLRLF